MKTLLKILKALLVAALILVLIAAAIGYKNLYFEPWWNSLWKKECKHAGRAMSSAHNCK